MSKIKMRCTTCGKWFQSANAKEVTCPDCVQKARKEKLAARNAPAATEKPAGTATPMRVAPPPPKPATSGTSHWVDSVSDVKIGEPEKSPERPKLPSSPAPREPREPYEQRGPGGYRPGGSGGPGAYRDRDDRGPSSYRPGGPGNYREGGYRPGGSGGPGAYRDRNERGPGSYRPGGPGTLDAPGYRPRQPMEGGAGRGPRPGGPRPDEKRGGKPPRNKPSTPPKPKREKIPPPTPFVATPEQVAQIEARYAELAVPQEFDGIRTQIATELGIPKKAIKKAVQEYRARHNIPSWWETQSYKGSGEELEKIKAAYIPYLPVPPVGVHKKISEELALKAGDVYQAIKAIRLEMNLPQFNDADLHAEELAALQKQKETRKKAETEDSVGEKGAVAVKIEDAPHADEAAKAESVEAQESEKTAEAETASQPAQTTGE